jgi:hypothetical protein
VRRGIAVSLVFFGLGHLLEAAGAGSPRPLLDALVGCVLLAEAFALWRPAP